jgi:hypothetical protein
MWILYDLSAISYRAEELNQWLSSLNVSEKPDSILGKRTSYTEWNIYGVALAAAWEDHKVSCRSGYIRFLSYPFS